MRRGTVALPSLSGLALRPPVVPTGAPPGKRQKPTTEAGALKQTRDYLRQLSDIVDGLENNDEWLRRFREASRNLFKDEFPSRPMQDWLSWGANGFEATPVPKSDAEDGTMMDQWHRTYVMLQALEGRIDAMRRRKGLSGLREKPKRKKQKTAPTPAQRHADREGGNGYFNTPEGSQDGPTFVAPEPLDGSPEKMLLREELEKKWPEGLGERLVAQRDPDGRCCASGPDR